MLVESHAHNFFTSNQYLNLIASLSGTYSEFSSNYHSDVVVSTTPDASLNELSL